MPIDTISPSSYFADIAAFATDDAIEILFTMPAMQIFRFADAILLIPAVALIA